MTSGRTRYEKGIGLGAKTILVLMAADCLATIWVSDIPLLSGITITFYIIGTTLLAVPALVDLMLMVGDSKYTDFSITNSSSHSYPPSNPPK